MTSHDRRQFVKTASAIAAGGYWLSSSRKAFASANEKLDIGVIGVGGRGAGDLAAVAHENIVALCDVDANRLGAAAEKHSGAKQYSDYRKLLQQENVDAVVIATPDHNHAPATVRALNRGLHVYCEKPLTHTVEEARVVAKLAAAKGVATQMGTQNHEHPGYRRLVELLKKQVIGQVSEVHIITDRPGTFWKQGLAVPEDKPAIPKHLNWDCWLGPAEERDYHPMFAPFAWRGWWDFGCGAIGDMAIHLMDPAFWGLNLGGKVRVSSFGPPAHPASGPTWMITRFDFEQRDKLAPCSVYWYEGEAQPPRDIASELPMNGSLFIGEKGRIAIQHDKFPTLLPEGDFPEDSLPDAFLPESPGHHQQWINSCKTGSPTGSNFSYAGPFTEVVLLGNIAYRVGEPIDYDPSNMEITNVRSANKLLTKKYRDGWEI
ncbi:MAG: Gfo/Idh/MocA family oxidoreductase [Planctomycetales bacterium]|nr:Gfo/Idh/MocA family oxidoreductase [Planctomycetales bacterium]